MANLKNGTPIFFKSALFGEILN